MGEELNSEVTPAEGVVEFCVRTLGRIRFVAPGREPELNACQLHRIERAWVLLEAGDEAAAAGLVRSVEHELWRGDFALLARLHAAGGRFPALHASARPVSGKGRKAARSKKAKAGFPVLATGAVQLTKDEKRDLAIAEEARAKAWLLSSIGADLLATGEMVKAEAIEDRIHQVQEKKAGQRWFEEVLAEIQTLDAQRGETIVEEIAPEEEGGGKRYRAADRDGLRRLYTSGAITDRLYKGGKAYRERYELIHRGLKSGLDYSVRGNGATDAFAAQVQEAGDQLRAIEARVRESDVSGLGITALRAIAGEGRSLRSLASSGSRQDAYSEALKRALAVVVEEIAAPKGRAA